MAGAIAGLYAAGSSTGGFEGGPNAAYIGGLSKAIVTGMRAAESIAGKSEWTDVFDYIIIGAGSAGSVLSNRLSAGNDTVCVLEAGPVDWNPFIHIPAGFMKTLVNPNGELVVRSGAQ